MKRHKVAIDLDETLAAYSGWQGVDHFGPPLPGAVEFTHRIAKKADIIIWTIRCNPDVNANHTLEELRNKVSNWLDAYGFCYHDIYVGPVKPNVAAFIDDKSVSCRPQENASAYFEAEAAIDRLLKNSEQIMWDASNINELIDTIDVDVDKLYFMENHEDECWEIRERDAVQDKSYPDNDAVIAKFYWAPELGQLLLETLRKLRKQNA